MEELLAKEAMEIAHGEFITYVAANMFARPDREVAFCWLDECVYTAIILLRGSPSYEDIYPIKDRLHCDMRKAEVDVIVVTGRTLPSAIARWYTIGDYVERVGQWLSMSSLAMSGLKHPRAALALAVGGCAFWGVHNSCWNKGYTAKYELEPSSFNNNVHYLLKDKALLIKKKPRSKIFNMSTVITACATAVAAGVFLWARHKF